MYGGQQEEKFYTLEEEVPSVIDKETSCQAVKIKKEYTPSDEQASSAICEDAISIHSAIFNLSISSIPSIVAMVIEYSIFSLNIMFVGFLDDPVAMSGCGLGSMTANVLVFSFGVGICGGIDTLVSQSYGRKDYDLCKIYLNIAKIVMVFLFVPLLMLLCFSEDLFILIGQPPESSHIAWKYLMICLPGLFFNMQFECIRRYLLAMGDYYPALIVFTIGFFVHILSLSIFVLVLEFGVIGVGISTSINFTLNFTLISCYVELQSDQNKTPSWKFGISLIQYAPEFLKYGLTSCLALFLFWWPFELTVIYGGILGLEQSAGSTILNSFAIFKTNINYGIALTASSIVGYNLGANLPNKARNSALSAYIFGSIVSLLICIVVFIFRFEIMHIYTSDLELIEMMESSMIEYMPMLFGCLFNWSVYSVLNGMGYQNLLVVFCFISFWIITLPLTLVLLFAWDYNFEGIWIGLLTGNLVFLIQNVGTLFFIDWKTLALESSKISQEIFEINEIK